MPTRYGAAHVSAEQKNCDLCGESVWVALSSPKAKPRCICCVIDTIDDKSRFAPPTARQMTDIKSKLG